ALARARRLAEDTSFAVYAMHTHELWCADLVRTLVMADSADNGENLDRLSELISKLLSEEKIGLEPMVFPQCSISKSIHELVTLAYSLANEALSASQAEFPAWLSALGDALATYCALFPVLHGSELQKVPALGWQFVNDCMYAAHHASLLAQTIAQLSDHPARSFLGAGNKQRQLLIQRQTEELAMQAHGPDDMFFAASTENSQQALARAVKQTRATLEHLARGMRPPATTPHVYYTAMGQCIDAVFETTIKGIFDLRDIGVDDSQALSDHCRRVLSLTALLPLDQQVLLPYTSLGAAHDGQGAYANDVLLAESDDDNDDDDDDDGDDESENDKGSVAQQRLGDQYCRLKDKLLQLADILVISRADILARRRAGLLAQFTVDELVRLVRALFSDTSERARDIEMLKTI
ncbi:ribosome biogenesis protein ytm1, partial [Coemansia asiatica]